MLSIFVSNFVLHSQNVSVSSGMRAGDLEKLKIILDLVPEVKYICLDVANGYSEHFVEFVKQVRTEFPNHTIMVPEFYIYSCFFFCCWLLLSQHQFQSLTSQQPQFCSSATKIDDWFLTGLNCNGIGKGLGNCYTRVEQQLFTISEVAADWHVLS